MKSLKLQALIALFALLILVFPEAGLAQHNEGKTAFKDLPSGHWAYEAIQKMVEKGIINGYADNTYRPDNIVSRADFAKLMVLSLGLDATNPGKSTFLDVGTSHWANKYVERAKYYLTGFRTSSGDYFKPEDPAVREDMAVALVKARKLENDDYDESLLDVFNDKEGISPKLKKYVALAVKHGIMKGNALADSTKKAFNPQGSLTRAQAAVLLYNVMNSSQEKVTYENVEENNASNLELQDEESSVQYTIPKVSGNIENGKIVLRWNAVKDRRFRYYKVVVSKNNPYPSYPEDGYLYCIEDSNTTYAVIDNREAYNGGDFGSYLIPGQKYYFSVTVVYEDVKLRGNVIQIAYPVNASNASSSFQAPVVNVKAVDGKVLISWNTINDSRLQGYKIVISKNNPTPKYPEDGYQQWITDKNRNNWVVQAGDCYNGGDFGEKLVKGQAYYFSVTAVYNGAKVRGNAVSVRVP
ncbi:MAG: S-layer homology domain-containing protein [Clostridia bacterium]|nr:S-layer homology domain-containing protein [Clostridia bacterium]